MYAPRTVLRNRIGSMFDECKVPNVNITTFLFKNKRKLRDRWRENKEIEKQKTRSNNTRIRHRKQYSRMYIKFKTKTNTVHFTCYTFQVQFVFFSGKWPFYLQYGRDQKASRCCSVSRVCHLPTLCV